MGRATEALSARVGTALGGFLSASLGNAAELILALAALRAGELEVVKASVTGSIIGNLLLVFGAAAVAGGLKREGQRFNLTAAGAGNATLFLATVALLVPALLHHGADPHPETRVPTSVAISVILLALYGFSLLFSLRTHAHLYAAEVEAARPAHWPARTAALVLVLATGAVVVVSEILVASLAGASQALGLSRIFVGVVVVALVGNAAEHSTAVLMALRGKMDLALQISVESSKQVALFVAPVLVFAGLLLGRPMDLIFSELEVMAVAVATGAITLVALDGESNWFEGAMLVAVYAVLAVAFYFA
jgi:Ca2+:H+ antiporter